VTDHQLTPTGKNVDLGFIGKPHGLEQTVRLEEDLLVTKDGPVIFTQFGEEALG
jgi:hypothetical protein